MPKTILLCQTDVSLSEIQSVMLLQNDIATSLSTMFCFGTAHLFSRSGMLRFLAAKHILRGMTFLSLVLFWCFGEPESSLPLKLGDWGAAPSHGRSDTNDGFLIYGVTSRMNLTMNKNQRRRLVFLLPIKNDN